MLGSCIALLSSNQAFGITDDDGWPEYPDTSKAIAEAAEAQQGSISAVEIEEETNVNAGFKGSKKHLNKPHKAMHVSGKKNTTSKTESLVKDIAENGPLNVKKDQYRLWSSVFSTNENITAPHPARHWLLGVLFGFQYDNKKDKYTIGSFCGFHFGKTRSKIHTETGDNIKGHSLGIFGSYGAWVGGCLDAMFYKLRSMFDSARFHTLGILTSDKKVNNNTLKLQASHLVKVPGNVWSVRFNLGHAYVEDITSAYTEKRAGAVHLKSSSVTNKTCEALAGIGLRWNKQGEEWRTRVTGVYQLGREYYQTTSGARISDMNDYNGTFNFNRTLKPQTIHHAI